ncbi:hypothetical protein Rs2_29932 [Raphanus sativus]|nr:hypothetical protein Rs2_29932 [Raphanus sativus]
MVAPRAMSSSSFGDIADDSTGSVVFPRINLKDPYKRLGISRMASVLRGRDSRSEELSHSQVRCSQTHAIESAHDKIIMHKFHQRKHPKFDLTKKVRELRQSKAVNFFFDRFQTPATAFLVKTAVTFAVLGALTVIATFYFIHQR